MQLNPYLNFNGQCEEAFRFYEQCFGGKIEFMMTHEGSPMADQVPKEWGKKIMHARLSVGNQVLLGSDAHGDCYAAPKGFAVSIDVTEPAEADRIFNALAENGTVQMPIQETFWAKRFGMLADRFGIPWMINCSKPM
jgi:PhnB protein